MRNSYIANTIIGLIAAAGLASCKGEAPERANRELVVDSSITALTKAVNTQVVSGIPAIMPESGARIFTAKVSGTTAYDTRRKTGIASKVSGRIERLLIRYNYQPVKRGELIMEIYSPDLAAAQRELLMIAASKDAAMLEKAKQRLLLLGMPASGIAGVLRTGEVLYRIPVFSNSNGYILENNSTAPQGPSVPMPAALPAADDGMGMDGSAAPAANSPAPAASPVLLREGQYVNAGQTMFTVYEAGGLVAEFSFAPALAAGIKKGQKLLFHPVDDRNNMQAGLIGLVEPVFQRDRNFVLVRVYIKDSGLKPGQLLTAYLPVVFPDGYWVPKEAVWRLGNRAVVFRKEGDVYTPADVTVGAELADKVQIITAIRNWQVAANAAYLVDSESFIKIKP